VQSVLAFLARAHLGYVREPVYDVEAPEMCTSSDRVIMSMLTVGTPSVMLGLGGYWCSSHTQNMDLKVLICKHKPLHRSDN